VVLVELFQGIGWLTDCLIRVWVFIGKGRKRIVWVGKPVILVLFALSGGYIPPLRRWCVSGFELADGPAHPNTH
jgi:hypothetical protein